MTRNLAALPVVLVLTLAARPALCEEDAEGAKADETTQEAISHFKKGVKFFEKEKYEAALVEFLKSHELRPNWALRYNIGVCYEETDRPIEAIEQFNLYLVEGGEKIPLERQEEVQTHIDELRQDLGTIIVIVNEADASILVDEFRKFTSPVGDPIPVEAGFHRVEVRKEGFQTYRAKVTVTSGEEVIHKVDLEAVVVPGEEDKDIFSWEELMPEGGEEEPARPLTGIWIGLGAGGGLAIAAAATGGVVLATKKKMQDEVDACDVTMTRDDCPAAYKQQDKAKALMITTNVLWGAAGAAAIAGLIVFLASKPSSEKPEEPEITDVEPEVSVLPVIVPGKAGSIGLEATVRF